MLTSCVSENMNRSTIIKNIRPEIPSISNTDQTTESELFQNDVLRPILKFQNEAIISIFTNNLKNRTIDFTKMNHQGRIDFVTQQIQKDLGLRNILIGIILAMMSIEEISIYFQNETEYRKRISKMVMERLADQLGFVQK